ncbi:MAG TPA: AAA family ATPase [Phycisphaerae bacterium]|jgi:predicted ATPase with chaperone activity|nr:AAA family ATPase [Phycisphaerae bacterium]HOJ56116.1 AAA family ATPase [Phycisphaerae bacterium]HOL28030.1 AAA family ATPase [Phycisphaerae bacterium]HPP22290.1 AAA family ATPase [Phycisphaerae bacterium]HPU31127.1 AAA family ATPase [Phycisphaerae bacterium]
MSRFSVVAAPSLPRRPVREAPMGASPTEPPAPKVTFRPPPVNSLAEAGLTDAMVDAIIFKYLLGVGSATGAKVAATLALPHPLIVERLADLKRQQLVGYVGSAVMGDFTYTLSETGRERARRHMEESMYVGPAPVPLSVYCEAVKAQSITLEKPDELRLREAFSDLLINDKMFATLGPAINSGRGMFLYGFPGNGKTSIAERITRCFGHEVYIPYAIHVDGFIIKLFDAEIHEVVPTPRQGLLKPEPVDERWVRISRPTVIVGGELTMDSLEVQFNSTTRISEASMQLKSNCGTLVIDDFGRQRMNPVELLNRWIVPLEKRFDFLALANGQKIQVPFDQLLVFSTNLEPKDLVDDAFLRRIPYKINVPDPTEEEFRALFRMMSKIIGFEHNEALVTRLIEERYKKTGRPFRCCQPRDLLTLAKNWCQYRGVPVVLSEENLDFAADVYFTIL